MTIIVVMIVIIVFVIILINLNNFGQLNNLNNLNKLGLLHKLKWSLCRSVGPHLDLVGHIFRILAFIRFTKVASKFVNFAVSRGQIRS